jgi:flavin reductase (DIM6/NTAB) family NADH-FMN oxidoreductase RutF
MTQAQATSRSVEPSIFRNTMGRFATGVAVVTTEHNGSYHGMTVNSLTSVSLSPPLLLVCLTRGTRTADAVVARGAFVVNILGDGQDELSDRFARAREDHFEGLQPVINRHGLPELRALGHLHCRVDAVHPGGDHEIVVGEVVELRDDERLPLIFYRGKYDTLTGHGRQADWYW